MLNQERSLKAVAGVLQTSCCDVGEFGLHDVGVQILVLVSTAMLMHLVATLIEAIHDE